MSARQVLDSETEVLTRFRLLSPRPISAMRIRFRGDYHLGQVLYTGKDFVIIDFEGEPARPLGERRPKRSPLRDGAGMLRSFHYASHAALLRQRETSLVEAEQAPTLEPGAQCWYSWIGATFLREYLATAGVAALLPRGAEELQVLLHAFLLEKAMYELGYELNSRPDWVRIPLLGILQLLGASA